MADLFDDLARWELLIKMEGSCDPGWLMLWLTFCDLLSKLMDWRLPEGPVPLVYDIFIFLTCLNFA